MFPFTLDCSFFQHFASASIFLSFAIPPFLFFLFFEVLKLSLTTFSNSNPFVVLRLRDWTKMDFYSHMDHLVKINTLNHANNSKNILL